MSLNADIKESIRHAHANDWKSFFDEKLQNEYDLLGDISIDDLTNVQARVKLLKELKTFFMNVCQPSK